MLYNQVNTSGQSRKANRNVLYSQIRLDYIRLGNAL